MKPSAWLALIGTAIAASGAWASDTLPAGVVATVNGQAVQRSVLDVLVATRKGAVDRKTLLDDLVMTEMLSQRARAAGFAEQPKVAAELALAQKRLLGQRLLERLAAEVKVDESELKERHRKLEADTALTTEHILLADETSARQVIAQLEAGAAFGEVARKHSVDVETRDKGGQLGTLNASELAPSYANAAIALKPGSYTRVPVQTDFGWHVILLRSKRSLPKPSFDTVRASLRAQVVNEQLEAQLAQWRKQAKLTVVQTP